MKRNDIALVSNIILAKECDSMKEQLEKDLKRHKRGVILAVLGFFCSLILTVVFFLQKDRQAWAFLAILAIDIYELPKEIKRYKEIKSKLQG